MAAGPTNPYVSPQVPDLKSGPVGSSTPEERTWGALAHLSGLLAAWLGGFSFLGPLIIWLIKKDQSPFVADQAKEALNFQIATTIAMWIGIATACFMVGFVIIAVVYVASLVFSILAAIEANKGVHYRYPYTLRFIS